MSTTAYVHEITLPSKGLPYINKDGKPSIPGGVIKIREFTGDDEDILNSTTLNDAAKIERIVSNCIVLPDSAKADKFDPIDLLATDRLIVLLIARALSLTPVYMIQAECDSCSHKWNHEFNLLQELDPMEMPRKAADGFERVYDPVGGITLRLPKAGNDLTLRLLTGRDNRLMVQEGQKARSPYVLPGTQNVPSMLQTMLSIKSIDGKPINHSNLGDMQDTCQFVKNLLMSDRRLIRETVASYDVGLPVDYAVTCPVCASQTKIGVALSPEFFRPTNV